MARYFLDTNVLIALTFRHDRWSIEASRLLDGKNSIYTSEYNVFEYCTYGNGPRVPQTPCEMNVDDEAERGVFGAILDDFTENVEKNIPMYNRKIDLNRHDLTLEKVLKIFFDNIKVRKQSKWHFTEYFKEYFTERKMTPRNAKRCVEELRDRELHDAKRRKETLLNEVEIKESTFHNQSITKRRIQAKIGIGDNGIPEDDIPWLLDAVALSNRNEVSRIVTGDKNHILSNQEELVSLFDISILYLLDKFESDKMDSAGVT